MVTLEDVKILGIVSEFDEETTEDADAEEKDEEEAEDGEGDLA